MASSYDVIGLGNTTQDFLGIIDQPPRPDAGIHMSEFIMQGGGVAATAMVAVARLGFKVAHVDAIGDDWVGKLILEDLEREGVSTELLQVIPGETSSCCIVLVDEKTGKRSLVCNPGSARMKAGLPDGVEEAIRSARALHVSNPSSRHAHEAGRIAREAGTYVTVDTADSSPRTFEFFAMTDALIASEFWPKGVAEDSDAVAAMKKAQAVGTKTVVVTLGEKGCVALDGDEVLEIPAFSGVPIVDTTGAGDVFHGSYIAALLEGWDLPSRLRYASAVSALKCGKLGGRAGIPTRERLGEFLAERNVTLTPTP